MPRFPADIAIAVPRTRQPTASAAACAARRPVVRALLHIMNAGAAKEKTPATTNPFPSAVGGADPVHSRHAVARPCQRVSGATCAVGAGAALPADLTPAGDRPARPTPAAAGPRAGLRDPGPVVHAGRRA